MLELVLGRAGTGKSEYIVNAAMRRANTGQQSILIVPEQSSFVFEKKLYLLLGAKASALVSVKSFTKLGEDIFKEQGGGALARVDDATRAALVRRAAAMVGDAIQHYRRHKKDAAFCSLMANTITELKNAGVSPELLADVGKAAASAQTRAKFGEISQIFAAYEHLLAAGYSDPADRLSAAAALCGQSSAIRECVVYIDGFTGFTEPEKKLIEGMLLTAQGVVCSLCCDPEGNNQQFAPFRGPGKTRAWLQSLARERGAELKTTKRNGFHRFLSPGLCAAEQAVAAGGVVPAKAETKGLHQIAARDLYDECERVCAEILYLVRERGYRFNEIAVIARDVERYRAPIRRTFSRFDIPIFCDWEKSLAYNPVVVFAKNALAQLERPDSEQMLGLLKTGLCDIRPEAVAALENYVFVWNIDGADWLAPFVKSPSGFTDRENPADAQKLAEIETARARVIGPYVNFKKAALGKTGGEALRALYGFLEQTGAAERLANPVNPAEAAETTAAYSIFDRLYNLFRDEEIPPADLVELLAIFAAAERVGEIPSTLEQLQVGAADRVRTDNPRAVFLLGLNEGVFPKTDFDAPILSFGERDMLNENGAELALHFQGSLDMEDLFFYRAATAARERLYLCWPKTGPRGETLERAQPLGWILNLGEIPGAESAADPARAVANLATAQKLYAELLERDAADAPLAGEIGLDAFGALLEQAAAEPEYAIDDMSAAALLGEMLSISPTRIESFSRCRFSYFLEYALRIKPLKKAEMSPLEAGSFVHSVVEQIMKQTRGALGDYAEPELAKLCEAAAEQYVETRLGADAQKLPRLRYLIERLSAQTKRLAMQLRREVMQSAFTPSDFELAIGRDGDVAPLRLVAQNGAEVFIEGKVDRVDTLALGDERYLRVLDYKTGTKKFALADVYYGLNIQMLVYLFSLCDNAKDRYGEVLPAGILYLPADPPIPEQGKADAQKAYRMDGLVLDDPAVVSAMERDAAGVFLPVSAGRGGALKSSEKLASLEEMGKIKTHIENTIVDMANELYAGNVNAQPIEFADGKLPCDYCDYTAVCRRDRVAHTRAVLKEKGAELVGRKAQGGEAE